MRDRLKAVILGLLFWSVFTPPVVGILLGQLVGIFVYAFTGNEKVREWVYETGKGTDSLNNAGYFDGDHRETISSHTGRWVLSGLPLPRKFRFVRWLTDLFEKDHAVKAIEEPFRNRPL